MCVVHAAYLLLATNVPALPLPVAPHFGFVGVPLLVAVPEKFHVVDPMGTGIELEMLGLHIRYIWALNVRRVGHCNVESITRVVLEH